MNPIKLNRLYNDIARLDNSLAVKIVLEGSNPSIEKWGKKISDNTYIVSEVEKHHEYNLFKPIHCSKKMYRFNLNNIESFTSISLDPKKQIDLTFESFNNYFNSNIVPFSKVKELYEGHSLATGKNYTKDDFSLLNPSIRLIVKSYIDSNRLDTLTWDNGGIEYSISKNSDNITYFEVVRVKSYTRYMVTDYSKLLKIDYEEN